MKRAPSLAVIRPRRKAIYDQIQQILYDDLPIFYVNTSLVPEVAQPDLNNWDPLPLSNTLEYLCLVASAALSGVDAQ